MSVEKSVRLQGREKLKNYGWAKALIGFGMLAVFYLIVESVAYGETVLLELLSIDFEIIICILYRSVTTLVALLLMPCVLGYFKMLYGENDEYDMSDVIYFFSSRKLYFKSIAFIFSFLLRMALPVVIFSLPVIGIVAINYFHEVPAFEYVFYTLVVFSMIFSLIYSTRYFVSIKLLCDDSTQNIGYYFKTSKYIMHNHYGDVIKLTLSFTPWFLLCITILPILYVFPYYTQTMCISGKWFCELSRDGQENELF